MKPILYTAFLLFIYNCGQSQDIEANFKQFVSDKDLSVAQIGFSIVEITSGKEIFSSQENTSMQTASTMKVITTTSALEIFGPDHQFETKLLIRGEIKDGTLDGDIIIRGEGDPTLGSFEFQKHHGDIIAQWAVAIAELGIKKITGNIIGDNTYFEGISLVGSTAVSDIGNYYGAGAHALSAYENKYEITFSSPNKEYAPTKILRTIPFDVEELFDIKNEVLSSKINKDNAYIYGIPDSDLQVIKGTIPMNKKSFKIKGSIPDPAKLLAFQLKKHLNSLFIITDGDALSYRADENLTNYHPEKLNNIFTIHSPALSVIVNYINLHSVNSYANSLVKSIGKKISNKGSYSDGIKAIINYWANKGIDTKGWYQVDGSGLSRANAVTANHISQVLALLNPMYVETFKKGLKDFGKSNRAIVTKSGYMNRVRSFAGYMTLKDGRKVAFSIIANNYDCSASAMRKKMEVFLLKL